MPAPASPMEIIREFHTERTRERIAAEARADQANRQGPRRSRRWTPGRRMGLQRFFPVWPTADDSTPSGASS